MSDANPATADPIRSIDRAAVLELTRAVEALTPRAVTRTEDIFRIEALGLEWDIGTEVHTPDGPPLCGADGKRVGIFLLHGGSGDFKSMRPMASHFAERFGATVVVMSFPGRHYLDDPSRDWPGDTMNSDGSVRTPIWREGEYVPRDAYDLVQDTSRRFKYGTRTHARARPGTLFHERMAAWPAAFEAAMCEACRRNFPPADWSVYVHGHSTGGPFVSMLSQRVPNVAGVLAVENSVFGVINEQKHIWGGGSGKIAGVRGTGTGKPADPWSDPFNDLYIRTWRDLARYRGSEALGQEGPSALMRLPSLMDEIMDRWDAARRRPQFKAEYMVTHNITGALEAAARTAARRLGMDAAATAALVERFIGYTRPLQGPEAPPLPPFLFIITRDSRDHSPEVYREVILPSLAAFDPAPKTAVLHLGAGVHFYTAPEPDLPDGVAPAAARLFVDAIADGFFLPATKTTMHPTEGTL